MKESRFFTLVWRINGLLLMVAGVLAIGISTFAGYKIITDIVRERSSSNIVNVEEKDAIKEEWQLGYLTNIEGGPYVMSPLRSEQNYAQSYYSKSSTSARNYLFINGTTNEQHWLLSSHQYLIVDFELLSERREKDVQAILYRVVKTDSNEDKRLTGDDTLTIGLSLPTGAGYKEILQGVNTFIGQRVITPTTLLIIFEQGGIGYSANVNLTDFTLYNKRPIAKVGA
ncbi:hypothetical protein [Desulfotalea psychrophila]|uniref:Uncharacterized protein n=1 Tax=Desulfotalea psychrophila (strain LSv54 / DSM 12343) TaxID=177439 RepID=Q6ANG4_DESPS|nr:hypothetical protein [Desulfotalea psychrophila]CAG36110.1 unknown protein [Desulfotalea psychrophila LSv54]